ncbi:sigma-70 family RNA polymerase sigma factor [Streptomyces sp. TBY4]|uniref:RNA polymerase sigma factor n=1 Tax=Streptomyces sp. TBY4 TaxID=2962030 RepID=UPI0020B813E6|nr:sigma-70 family RNA polymerase sigma factor [Streptomyces sp. TBY4]MCP3759323.1 sigma-70 family RNA polymerase sigma factor [Streptomyces sp. TBY4]
MDTETETDDRLLGRSAKDARAFEVLVVRMSGVLHGYLARRAPAAADDLLAEVWLQAFSSRKSFDPELGTARTWLFGVARNVLAAHWRRIDREQQLPASNERASDPWHAVDRRLDAAAVGPLLRRTMAGLPHVERELLLLVAWEQLTPTEAAAVVGIPPGTARSRLHRARTRVRAVMQQVAYTRRLTGDPV